MKYLYKPFTPEFLKWDHPSLNLDNFIVANRGLVKINHTMANGVDPDEMASYDSSHLDLHCLLMYPCWSAGMHGYKDQWNLGEKMILYISML